MRVNQLLFLLEDFLYELLVVIAQVVDIASIVLFKFDLCLNSWIKLVYLYDLHWILCRPSLNCSITNILTKPLIVIRKHRCIIASGTLSDVFEAWLFEVIRITSASEHLSSCLWSRCLRSPWGDQACRSLLGFITILETEEALRWRLSRALLTTILYSLYFTT